MKKLTTTLLVAVLAMLATTFAQTTIGEPEYFDVTNKTTNETKRIMLDDFKLKMGIYQVFLENFPLGIYEGDEIEISYGGGMSKVKPRLIWSYAVGNIGEENNDTTLTKKIKVPKLASDNQDFWVGFTYQIVFSIPETQKPIPHLINFKDLVHNDTRFYSSCAPGTALRVTYNHYDEVRPHLTKNPYVTVTNAYSGVVVFRGYMDDNGEITFNTGGKTGIVIVTVTVNGVTLPAEKTYIY